MKHAMHTIGKCSRFGALPYPRSFTHLLLPSVRVRRHLPKKVLIRSHVAQVMNDTDRPTNRVRAGVHVVGVYCAFHFSAIVPSPQQSRHARPHAQGSERCECSEPISMTRRRRLATKTKYLRCPPASPANGRVSRLCNTDQRWSFSISTITKHMCTSLFELVYPLHV